MYGVRFERSDYVPGTWGVYDSSGRMTYITRMFTSGISISEFSTGGCGPIPDENGYGDTKWERYVSGEWKQTTNKDICWEPKNPGIYRVALNSDREPLTVYVYYAGNMADSAASKLSNELQALGLNPGEGRFQKSLVVEYRNLMKPSP